MRAAIDGMNAVASACNAKTTTLEADQRAAKNTLRLSEDTGFIDEVSLGTLEADVAAAKVTDDARRDECDALEAQIRDLEQEISDLQSQLKDERRGAQAINAILEHHFGHASLRLVAEEDPRTSSYKFKVKRGDADAYNLSEGECSLVAPIPVAGGPISSMT